jgi:hypothetical protein
MMCVARRSTVLPHSSQRPSALCMRAARNCAWSVRSLPGLRPPAGFRGWVGACLAQRLPSAVGAPQMVQARFTVSTSLRMRGSGPSGVRRVQAMLRARACR